MNYYVFEHLMQHSICNCKGLPHWASRSTRFFFVCVRHSFISISSSPNAMICGEVNEQHLILGIYFICISYDVLSLKSEWLASHHVYQQMMTNYVNLYYSCFFRHNSSSVLDIAYEPYAPNARSHHLCPGCCYSTHRYSSFYS